MLKIIADQNLYKLTSFLPADIDLRFYDPSDGIPDTTGFDALLLRTVTKLHAKSFPGIPSSLKFIGTGSSGSDHIDIEYLESKGITFADAKGCNARAVAEYIITSLLLWQENKKVKLQDFTYGIIGAGKAGSAVADVFKKFGLNYKLFDPPREQRDSDFTSSSIEEILNCDILTFHVPLTCSGEFSTYHWLNEQKLSGQSFKLILNAARGGVIDEENLIEAMNTGAVDDIVIDVWENEPDFNPEVLEQAFISTPHIAGYSEQAKLNASMMVCEKLCEFFGLKCPPTENLYETKSIKLASLNYSFKDLLLRLHPIKEYDAVLRDLSYRLDRTKLFAKLRTDRPFRFEYGFLKLEDELLRTFDELKYLGFKEIEQN